jgi:TolB protein
MQIPTYGGKTSPLQIKKWVYGEATGSLYIAISDGNKAPIAARVSIMSANGDSVTNPMGATYEEPKTGRSYFYVDG